MTRPLVLVDVDGVINALSTERYGEWDDYVKTYAYAQSRKWGIIYSPTVVAWLNTLHERADVAWLTTWEDWAPASLAESVGLVNGKDWPVFGRQAETEYTGKFSDRGMFWWKGELVIAADIPDDRKLVWLDDDLSYYTDAFEWAQARPNTLPIAVNGNPGITQEVMDRVDAFLLEEVAA